jgi:hypothetical protein
MPPSLTTIGFDADDTLWQNEHFYRMTEGKFLDLLGEHGDREALSARSSKPRSGTSRFMVSASRVLRCR